MPIRNNRNVTKIKPYVVRNVRHTVNRQNTKKQEQQNRDLKQVRNYGEINPIWSNATVYIVGGGPSLTGFDWKKLRGKNVIAINKAFQVMPWANVMYWTDSRFYRWYADEINRFMGLKVTCRPFSNMPDSVTLLKANSKLILDDRPDYIAHGNNSGYGAINLAVKLGAKKIYLLGYDMTSNNRNTHWHEGYDVRHNPNIYQKMITYFDSLPDQLAKKGVKVINANPKSELKVFPKCKLEDALSDSV